MASYESSNTKPQFSKQLPERFPKLTGTNMKNVHLRLRSWGIPNPSPGKCQAICLSLREFRCPALPCMLRSFFSIIIGVVLTWQKNDIPQFVPQIASYAKAVPEVLGDDILNFGSEKCGFLVATFLSVFPQTVGLHLLPNTSPHFSLQAKKFVTCTLLWGRSRTRHLSKALTASQPAGLLA